MKKIYLGLCLSAAVFTTSCDMDTTNYGVIDTTTYIQTMDDCQAFVNGMYTHMRGKSGGSYLFYPDVQMDQFIGIVDNGNRGGIYSKGEVQPGDTDLANLYYNLYIQVNDANYFVPRVDEMINSGNFTEAEVALLNYYKGVAMFSRSYAYWYLFDKYVFYSEANLDTPGMGLQIEKEYRPSGDRGSYVGRSTIRESVEYVATELQAAYDLVRSYEVNVSAEYCSPNAIRVSSYTIAALQARFALLVGDYATAAAKADLVIESGNYALTEIADYADMWVNDEGSELLFVPFAAPGTGGQSIGANYLRSNKAQESDYIPTYDVVNSYDKENDVRFEAFFTLFNPLVVQGENFAAYAFTKFNGNPALNTGTANAMLNKAKPFRLSELYLIAAEAYAADGAQKDEAKANAYLNDLRVARIADYEANDFAGAALVDQIRKERAKELIGEGFRMGDLRRWGNGFKREAGFEYYSGQQAELANIMDVIVNAANGLTYTADDYRFVWPIPTREMQVNPQLNGQQNRGY